MLWIQPGLLQLEFRKNQSVSGIVLKTKAEELSKEMGSNSVGHLEIERLKESSLKHMQQSNES